MLQTNPSAALPCTPGIQRKKKFPKFSLCVYRALLKCSSTTETTTNYRFSPFDSTNFLVFLTGAGLPELEDLMFKHSAILSNMH